jgi:S1-C subfamily serine protease
MFPTLAAVMLAGTPGAPVPKPAPLDPRAYAYVGVWMSNIRDQDTQLRIDQPLPGTPAADAGLRDGDVIVRLGDVQTKTFADFADYILDLRPGTRLLVEVKRSGELKRLWVTLGVRPPPPDYPDPDFSRKTIYGSRIRP